jgi:hypothetical protein
LTTAVTPAASPGARSRNSRKTGQFQGTLNADRLALHVGCRAVRHRARLALHHAGDAGVVAERVRRPPHLVLRLGADLARLPHEHVAELLCPRLERIRPCGEGARPLDRIAAPIAVERVPGRADDDVEPGGVG